MTDHDTPLIHWKRLLLKKKINDSDPSLFSALFDCTEEEFLSVPTNALRTVFQERKASHFRKQNLVLLNDWLYTPADAQLYELIIRFNSKSMGAAFDDHRYQ